MHKIVRIIDAVVIFKMKYLLDACENKAKYMYSMYFYFLWLFLKKNPKLMIMKLAVEIG